MGEIFSNKAEKLYTIIRKNFPNNESTKLIWEKFKADPEINKTAIEEIIKKEFTNDPIFKETIIKLVNEINGLIVHTNIENVKAREGIIGIESNKDKGNYCVNIRNSIANAIIGVKLN